MNRTLALIEARLKSLQDFLSRTHDGIRHHETEIERLKQEAAEAERESLDLAAERKQIAGN